MWRTCLLLVIFTADAQFDQSHCNTTDFYTAAVVEYAPPVLPHVSADLVLESNAAAYIMYITEAAKNQVDIIVFPEGGLHGKYVNKFVNVPDPTDRISPCDFNSSYHLAVVMLSCAARNSSLYVIVNLSEKYLNPTFNKTEYYNTNVAFDRNGTVIARYRKFNPYGEPVTKPTSPDHHVFETDFGVHFGMFICFDLEFLEPAIVLARDYGVKHFVFSHCWISELPFLTALQAQWGWAYSLDVVLLASGCNNPSQGGTGSGIYHGRQGALQAFQTNVITSKLLIANISKSFDCVNESRGRILKVGGKSEGDSNSDYLEPIETVGRETEGDNSSLIMLKDYLDVYKSQPLLPDVQDYSKVDQGNYSIDFTTETTICHNNFCCGFKVEMTTMFGEDKQNGSRRGDDYSDQLYRMVVFDGVRWYGGGLATGGIQVCGIVACVNDSLSSCGLRADSPSRQQRVYGKLFQTGTVFQKISLTPKFLFNNTFVYPDILVTGTGNEFGKLMPSSNFTFEEFDLHNNSLSCSLTIHVPVPNLITAAVYARQFDRDGQKRTDISSGYNSNNYQNVFVMCVLFLFTYFY